MGKAKIFLSLITFVLVSFVFILPSSAQEPPQIIQELLSKVKATSWPNDIPLFPKATPVVPSVSSDHNPAMMDLEIGSIRTFWLTNQDSAETTISWYEQSLPQNGWTVFSKQEFMQIYQTLEIKEFEGVVDLFDNLPGAQKIDVETIYGKQYLSSWKPEVPTDGCRFFSVNAFDTAMGKEGIGHLVLMELLTRMPCPNACEIPPEQKQERQEFISRIGKTYGFGVHDSNVCGRDDICGANTPWSVDDLKEMENTLNKLPDCFTKNLKLQNISGLFEVIPEWFPDIPNLKEIFNLFIGSCCDIEHGQPQKPVNSGFYFPLTSIVVICDRTYISKYTLEYVLAHELTHALQWSNVTMPTICNHLPCPGGLYTNPLMISWLKETGWSLDGICLPFLGCPGATIETPQDLPTKYAKDTNDPGEDIAESVALYVTNPKKLLEISPRRYNFVKNKIMCGKEYL